MRLMKRTIILTEEQINSILNESFSRYIYHFTTYEVLYNMLKMDAFILSSSLTTQVDRALNEGYSFYMSFTRQHTNKVGFPAWKNYVVSRSGGPESDFLNVRITVNGNLLGNVYKGSPVNYHHKEIRTSNQQREVGSDPAVLVTIRQSEDRLLSNEPVIEGISRFIERIDILAPKSENGNMKQGTINSIYKILRISKNNYAGKVFVYDNERDFNMPRSANFINNKILSALSDDFLRAINDKNLINKNIIKQNTVVTRGHDKIKLLAAYQLEYIGETAMMLSKLTGGDLSDAERYIDYIFSIRQKNVGNTKVSAEKRKALSLGRKLFKTRQPITNYLKNVNYFSQSFSGSTRDMYALMMALIKKLIDGYGFDSYQKLLRSIDAGRVQIKPLSL